MPPKVDKDKDKSNYVKLADRLATTVTASTALVDLASVDPSTLPSQYASNMRDLPSPEPPELVEPYIFVREGTAYKRRLKLRSTTRFAPRSLFAEKPTLLLTQKDQERAAHKEAATQRTHSAATFDPLLYESLVEDHHLAQLALKDKHQDVAPPPPIFKEYEPILAAQLPEWPARSPRAQEEIIQCYVALHRLTKRAGHDFGHFVEERSTIVNELFSVQDGEGNHLYEKDKHGHVRPRGYMWTSLFCDLVRLRLEVEISGEKQQVEAFLGLFYEMYRLNPEKKLVLEALRDGADLSQHRHLMFLGPEKPPFHRMECGPYIYSRAPGWVDKDLTCKIVQEQDYRLAKVESGAPAYGGMTFNPQRDAVYMHHAGVNGRVREEDKSLVAVFNCEESMIGMLMNTPPISASDSYADSFNVDAHYQKLGKIGPATTNGASNDELIEAAVFAARFAFGAALRKLDRNRTLNENLLQPFHSPLNQKLLHHRFFSVPFSIADWKKGRFVPPFNPVGWSGSKTEVGAIIRQWGTYDRGITFEAFDAVVKDLGMDVTEALDLVSIGTDAYTARTPAPEHEPVIDVIEGIMCYVQEKYGRGFGDADENWNNIMRCLEPCTHASLKGRNSSGNLPLGVVFHGEFERIQVARGSGPIDPILVKQEFPHFNVLQIVKGLGAYQTNARKYLERMSKASDNEANDDDDDIDNGSGSEWDD